MEISVRDCGLFRHWLISIVWDNGFVSNSIQAIIYMVILMLMIIFSIYNDNPDSWKWQSVQLLACVSQSQDVLTHRGRVTSYIYYMRQWTAVIGSTNGFTPARRQALTWADTETWCELDPANSNQILNEWFLLQWNTIGMPSTNISHLREDKCQSVCHQVPVLPTVFQSDSKFDQDLECCSSTHACSTDHNEILHTSWQCNCKSEHFKLCLISNSIKISLVGPGPGQSPSKKIFCLESGTVRLRVPETRV